MDGESLRRLREVLILFTLLVLPGLISPGSPMQVFSGGAPMSALTVRNAAFILLLLYLSDLSGDSKRVIGTLHGTVPTALLIALVLFLVAAAFRALFNVINFVDPIGTSAPVPGGLTIAATLFLLSVAAVEEMFFRGYLLVRLQQLSRSFSKSVVIAALLFALGHGYQGVAGLVFSFSAALFLGILWKWRPNVVAFALGHGVYNILALVFAAHG